MGKTYRKEKQYKKARDAREGETHKVVDHHHERTVNRQRLRDTVQHWSDEDPIELDLD